MKTSEKLVICYCGSDMPWAGLQKYGCRRRNAYLLKGFAEHPEVRQVFVFITTMRSTFFQKMLLDWQDNSRQRQKIVDVYVTPLIPERWWLPGVKPINRLLAYLQVWWQTGHVGNWRPIVWCYWPKGYQLAQYLNLPGDWVFDADHNIIDDINQDPTARSSMEELLRECATRTRLIVASARSMLHWFAARGVRHCAYLRNGVDLTRFDGDYTPPLDVQDIPHPRIGYLGVLSHWIDYELLAGLARKRPDWSFVLIGAPYKILPPENLTELTNITLLGSRNPREVPSYLSTFDVGLVLYRLESATWLDVDSMKIFEYLAAGVPTVSTPFHPNLSADFGGLLELAGDVEEFEKSIERLLGWNDNQRADWEQRCCKFLKGNTWERRAHEAVSLIQNAISPRTPDPAGDRDNVSQLLFHAK
jgi:glycosyltransferase involved in cell wall biosynthesis